MRKLAFYILFLISSGSYGDIVKSKCKVLSASESESFLKPEGEYQFSSVKICTYGDRSEEFISDLSDIKKERDFCHYIEKARYEKPKRTYIWVSKSYGEKCPEDRLLFVKVSSDLGVDGTLMIARDVLNFYEKFSASKNGFDLEFSKIPIHLKWWTGFFEFRSSMYDSFNVGGSINIDYMSFKEGEYEIRVSTKKYKWLITLSVINNNIKPLGFWKVM